MDIGRLEGDRVGPGGPGGWRARQGAVAGERHTRRQRTGLRERDRGVPVCRDGERTSTARREVGRRHRGEHRRRGRHRQGEGLGGRLGVAVGRLEADRVGAGAPEGRRAGQGAVAAQGHARGQAPGLAVADGAIPVRRDREGPRVGLGERCGGRRGEHRARSRHRQGEGLGGGLGVGVRRRDGDRVGPRRCEGRRAGQGAVARQGDAARQCPGLRVADRAVPICRHREGPRRVLGERSGGRRGEHGARSRHRQAEGLRRRVGVGVGRLDAERVGARRSRRPACRPGCRCCPGSRPRAGSRSR